jgi:hypothetical protein
MLAASGNLNVEGVRVRKIATLPAGAALPHHDGGRIALHLTALVVVGLSLACWSMVALLVGWVW